jgi:2-oxo-4-hydroxy-4-carboxy-5-ureidoimidazoline decarboxylase
MAETVRQNAVLERWNSLNVIEAAREILPCCGSLGWAEALTSQRPFDDAAALLSASNEVWLALPETDWMEAFNSHPRIGESHAQATATAASLKSSAQEQSVAISGDDAARFKLADSNRRYEQRFGRIFIICAKGRTAQEILTMLEIRMKNDDATELREAVEQQRQITSLRLRKWLGGE